jgi:CMP-2-keto-3-deoxyoctulosonic acid synthetase
MKKFNYCVLVPCLVAALMELACADDDQPEQGPTQAEMQDVASEFCEIVISCGSVPHDVTLDDCIANQLGTYQYAPECVARYHLDECLTTQTCEEIERLRVLNIGDCLDARDDVSRVSCPPPRL